VSEGSYYSRRAARDPGWRARQIAAAAERKRCARERDPESFRLAERAAQRRCWERQTASGLTFAELHRRVGGNRQTLELIVREEVRRGHVDWLGLSRRYRPNGLDPELAEALASLCLPARDASRQPNGRVSGPSSTELGRRRRSGQGTCRAWRQTA
jgi:hypothetical protein